MGHDGYTDLLLWFEQNALVAALGSFSHYDTVQVSLYGRIDAERYVCGSDCVVTLIRDEIVGEPVDEADSPYLAGNFPNPFNPATEISFSLPEATDVRLEVFNIIGQRLAVLVDARLEAGEHRIHFEGGSLPSGVYLYRFRAGDVTQTRKMVLLK